MNLSVHHFICFARTFVVLTRGNEKGKSPSVFLSARRVCTKKSSLWKFSEQSSFPSVRSALTASDVRFDPVMEGVRSLSRAHRSSSCLQRVLLHGRMADIQVGHLDVLASHFGRRKGGTQESFPSCAKAGAVSQGQGIWSTKWYWKDVLQSAHMTTWNSLHNTQIESFSDTSDRCLRFPQSSRKKRIEHLSRLVFEENWVQIVGQAKQWPTAHIFTRHTRKQNDPAKKWPAATTAASARIVAFWRVQRVCHQEWGRHMYEFYLSGYKKSSSLSWAKGTPSNQGSAKSSHTTE